MPSRPIKSRTMRHARRRLLAAGAAFAVTGFALPAAAADAARLRRVALDESRAKGVVMYSASWCVNCTAARRYFTEKNIEFVEYDVETSREARARFDAFPGRGVPLLLVAGTVMRGFSVKGFEARYELEPVAPPASAKR